MTIVNVRKDKYTVYIGRPGPFGNKFIIGKDGTREEVIAKYEESVRKSPAILNLIKNGLKENDVLGCWCAPLDCHGRIIIKLWKELHEQNN